MVSGSSTLAPSASVALSPPESTSIAAHLIPPGTLASSPALSVSANATPVTATSSATALSATGVLVPPVSASPNQSTSAPVPNPAPVKSPWIEVLRRNKPKPFTKAAIASAADPLDLLLAKPGSTPGKTTKITSMILSTSLVKAAKATPFLTWRTICARAAGTVPLNIVPITPERVEVYWDASSEASIPSILDGLARNGIAVDHSPPTAEARGRRLRAYLTSYFVLLRLSALDGLDDDSKAWVLTQASRRIKRSGDKVSAGVWKKRIKRDALDFKLGELS